METKICSKCGEEKPLSDFYKSKTGKNGLMGKCKACCAKWHEDYYCKNRTEILKRQRKYWEEKKKKLTKRWKEQKSVYNRKKRLKRFDLTPEDYDRMFEAQNGLCAICGLPEIKRDYRNREICKLSIDHNHNTGKVRGLLCSKCNPAIGSLNIDNLGILNLQKAIEYVRKYAYL